MWQIFVTFFKIGMFTFGGGYAMIPLIEESVVRKKKWLTEEEFMEFLSVSQGLPGAMAINISNFIGYKIMGIRGLIMACLGTLMPSFIIILTIAAIMTHFPVMKVLQPVMDGMLPAIAVLIVFSAYNLGKKLPKKAMDWILFTVSLALLVLASVSPLWIILGGIGFGLYRGWNR